MERYQKTLAVLAAGCFTAACNCDARRTATFTGRLGDSTVAAGFFPTVPGGLDLSLGEFNPIAASRSSTRRVSAKVNYSTFADSVLSLRVSDFNDAARTPIVSFAKSKGTQSGSVFVLDYSIVDDSASFEKLWNVLAKGDGMLEVQPHQGAITRARVKPLAVGGWQDFCT